MFQIGQVLRFARKEPSSPKRVFRGDNGARVGLSGAALVAQNQAVSAL
jgi:hypothetical protein